MLAFFPRVLLTQPAAQAAVEEDISTYGVKQLYDAAALVPRAVPDEIKR